MTSSVPPTPVSMPRWARVLLVVSLAINLLVAGLLVGDLFAHGGPGRGPRPAEMALDPLVRALAEDDRRAILQGLRGHPDLQPLGREARQEALGGIVDALRAEPFDPEGLRAALSVRVERVAGAQAAVQDALVARIDAMAPEERAAFADRLSGGRH